MIYVEYFYFCIIIYFLIGNYYSDTNAKGLPASVIYYVTIIRNEMANLFGFEEENSSVIYNTSSIDDCKSKFDDCIKTVIGK